MARAVRRGRIASHGFLSEERRGENKMRRPLGPTALALVALLAAPLGAAAADGETARMTAMEERLRALEDKLEASSATIEAQRDLIQRHAPAVSQGAGMDSFLSDLDIGGFVTGSYLYNFNRPEGNAGAQPLCQFNCRHDEFSFDAAMLSIGKSADNPGEAGFQLDLLFGQNGDISRGLSPTTTAGAGVFGDSDFGVFVQEAYVTYNWDGTEVKFGNWETLLGYELLDSHLNSNITHGILFTWAIPLYHTGILFSGDLGESMGWALGLTNGFNNVLDQNDNKGIVGILSFEEGPLFTSLSWFFGSETPNVPVSAVTTQPGTSDDLMILDLVATLELSDTASLWLNVDYGEQEDATVLTGFSGGGVGLTATDDSEYWGIAVGLNLALSDRLSFALRGEYWEDEDNVRGALGTFATDSAATAFSGVRGADVEMFSLTGTLKYQLTDNAYIRGELRWDEAEADGCPVAAGVVAGACDGELFPDGGSTDDDSLLGIVEISYVFD